MFVKLLASLSLAKFASTTRRIPTSFNGSTYAVKHTLWVRHMVLARRREEPSLKQETVAGLHLLACPTSWKTLPFALYTY
ncbi:MAG: hypothetical protein Aurels2KO_28470 [Aureliella sp.]